MINLLVDHEKLSSSAQREIQHILIELHTNLAKIGPIHFNTLEWIEYRKRTLSEKSRVTTQTITKKADGKIYIYRESIA